MAISTMRNIDKVQTPVSYWKFELSDDLFRRSPDINYICVPTTIEFKIKIISLLETLSFLPWESVLVQYWAAKEIGNTIVLTTTCQPFGIWGNNIELQLYHKGCSDHKLYVHPKEGVAFGLSGRVFLNGIHEQTQNVHRYHRDHHRPPCEDAIFTNTWGSFGVPVINADKSCVGVLEFIMDTPQDSYDANIGAVYRALQHTGFQYPVKTNHPRTTYVHDRKRLRKTKSFNITKYCCLVPYFGLSSADAAAKLQVTTSTFRNVCRDVGIPEWPWISDRYAMAFSDPTTSETSSFESSVATGYGNSVRSLDETKYMVSNIGLFGVPLATNHISSVIPNWNAVIYEWPYTKIITSTEASDISSSGESVTTEDVGIYKLLTMTTKASPHETLTDQIASGSACTIPWVEYQRARPDFMQEFDEMKYLDLDWAARMCFDF